MNAWDVDPNLKLSTYAEIGHGIALLFNRLTKTLGKKISLRRTQSMGKSQQVAEMPKRVEAPYCCMTPFKELADNHRLYYPIPHVF